MAKKKYAAWPKRQEKAEIMLEIRLDETRTDEDSRNAYDSLYQETDISQRQSFYLWLIDRFDLRSDDVYLDISCGRGHLPALAEEEGVAAYGLDLSYRALQSGRREMGCNQLVVGNAQTLPYADNSFTAISNIGSIEHYVDMGTAVREMARVLRPGGRAFVLVPNTFSLLHNVWIAFRQGRTNVDDQPIQRYAARQEWQRLLEENGLVVDQTVKYEMERPRIWEDFASTLQHPKRLVRLALTPFVPLNLAFCFLFLCRKPI